MTGGTPIAELVPTITHSSELKYNMIVETIRVAGKDVPCEDNEFNAQIAYSPYASQKERWIRRAALMMNIAKLIHKQIIVTPGRKETT